MIFTVWDIEADGLLDTVTKIHCLSYNRIQNGISIEKKTLTSYEEIILFLEAQKILVGHNIVCYDIPVIELILGIEIKATLIDTLGLSYYLFPMENHKGKQIPRRKHGLEAWGEHYGVPKPEIVDWKNLSIEEYIHRCEEDVEINSLLWIEQYIYLKELYNNVSKDIFRCIAYFTFKLSCIREQEENPCHIDKKSCEKNLYALNEEIDIKVYELSSFMPLKKTYKTVNKPKKPFKKDGSLSIAGQRWLNWMNEFKLSADTESFEMIDKIEDGNPNSHAQVKEWLLELGWEPTIYKEAVSKVTGIVTQNPQLSDNDNELCPNLVSMFKEHPYLENLENLSLMRHRKGVFESFLETISDKNTVPASIGGFTNSLRMQHRRPIVNLPKVGTYLGEEIRGLIVVPNDDYLVCGSDIHSLEDSTKQHFMYFFDPEYVKQMRVPGFDPHLDIALRANIMTQEEVDRYKELKKKDNKTQEEHDDFQDLDFKRFNSKTGNFAAVYGAGVPKLTQVLKCTHSFANNFHDAYWIRNKAVKQVADSVITKTINNQLWLFNPISKLWYSVRVQKDIFSVLNQGTGAYVEDRWIFYMRKRGLKMILQYHDEVAMYLKKEDKEFVRTSIEQAMEDVNKELQLNVSISVSIDFGKKYSEIH